MWAACSGSVGLQAESARKAGSVDFCRPLSLLSVGRPRFVLRQSDFSKDQLIIPDSSVFILFFSVSSERGGIDLLPQFRVVPLHGPEVSLSRFDVRMSEKTLDGIDVHAAPHETGSIVCAEGVHRLRR